MISTFFSRGCSRCNSCGDFLHTPFAGKLPLGLHHLHQYPSDSDPRHN